jgi:GxxExxY protein
MIDTNEVKISDQGHSLIYKEEVFRIIGACMEVHNKLGQGFLEPVYQEALEYEFGLQGIPFAAQYPITITYKDKVLEKKYLADFIAFNRIIVEIKALTSFDSSHIAQVLNYLKATKFSLGLLVNFGSKSLEWKRIVH